MISLNGGLHSLNVVIITIINKVVLYTLNKVHECRGCGLLLGNRSVIV